MGKWANFYKKHASDCDLSLLDAGLRGEYIGIQFVKLSGQFMTRADLFRPPR